MVTSEGIRANLKKTKALADLQSPRTLKEMQSLSGKLAAPISRKVGRKILAPHEVSRDGRTLLPNEPESPLQANYVIREIHMGSCGMHMGPRAVWGMDILGPLPTANGGAKFVIVAIDYFTKWIEVKPLVRITDKELVNDPFKSWCRRFEIHQMNIVVAHPQANELVERANKSLMEGIKTRLRREKERRETTAIREARYKTKMEQYYNKKIHPASFKLGEFVFRRNEASRAKDQGKLGPKWEGPYRVMEAYENGCYKL
ncbi:reverse transcriptase domain-containing protein [Tanacetum coccineum]